MRVKAVQGSGEEGGGTLVGALAESLDPHGKLSGPAWEVADSISSGENCDMISVLLTRRR